MRHPLADQRIVRGATSASLSWQATDADGEPTAPAGTVTVSVTRSDGTALYTDEATSGSSANPRTLTLAAADVSVVDRLTVTWTDNSVEVATEYVDVVGGTVGSFAALSAIERTLSDKDNDFARARRSAENRYISVTGRLPFQRLEVQWFDNSSTDCLTGAWWADLAEVRWARIYTSPTAYTALTASQLAEIRVPDELSRFDRRGTAWSGSYGVEVGYVAGMASIPDDLGRAFAAATRRELTIFNTGVPDRSDTWASDGQVSIGLARPGKGRAYGIDDIDDVFAKYADPRPQVA